MISNKMHKDLITKLMHTPLPKGIRTKGRGQGGGKLMGFSGMWAGVQKEVEPN